MNLSCSHCCLSKKVFRRSPRRPFSEASTRFSESPLPVPFASSNFRCSVRATVLLFAKRERIVGALLSSRFRRFESSVETLMHQAGGSLGRVPALMTSQMNLGNKNFIHRFRTNPDRELYNTSKLLLSMTLKIFARHRSSCLASLRRCSVLWIEK